MCLCSCCVCFFCCFSSLLMFLCSWGPISWGLSNSAVNSCGQNALKAHQTDQRSDQSWNWKSLSSVWSCVLKWFKHVQSEGFEVNKIQVFLWQHLFCVDFYLSLCSFSLELCFYDIIYYFISHNVGSGLAGRRAAHSVSYHPSIHPSIHFHPLHTRMFHKWLTPVSDSILRSDWLEGVSSLSSSPETVSMLALPVPSSQSLTVCSMCFQLNLYKKLCVRTGWTYSHILFSNINRHQMCHSLIVKLFVLKTVSGC